MKQKFALKDIRIKKGFTRVKLAEVSKIPIETIKALETGKNEPLNAKLSTLVALARALKCKVKDFYPEQKVIWHVLINIGILRVSIKVLP